MYEKYKSKIKLETELSLHLMNRTKQGISLVKKAKTELKNDEIWLIKFWGTKIRLKPLVDFLFYHKLDVFDIEYDPIIHIYVCKMDAYRITNNVVRNVYKNMYGGSK